MSPSVEASPWGLGGVYDVLGGSHLYELQQAGRHALVAVRPVSLEHGQRLDVVGLVSLGDRLASGPVLEGLDTLAHLYQADALAMCTRHPHLVRACSRGGWALTGTVMNKVSHVRQ